MENMANSGLNFARLIDTAAQCMDTVLIPAEREIIQVYIKLAVLETPYALNESLMVDAMQAYGREHYLDGQEMLGIGGQENRKWVGPHEYLINKLVPMVFFLRKRTDADGRKRAAAIFSLIGYAIRRQSP